ARALGDRGMAVHRRARRLDDGGGYEHPRGGTIVGGAAAPERKGGHSDEKEPSARKHRRIMHQRRSASTSNAEIHSAATPLWAGINLPSTATWKCIFPPGCVIGTTSATIEPVAGHGVRRSSTPPALTATSALSGQVSPQST